MFQSKNQSLFQQGARRKHHQHNRRCKVQKTLLVLCCVVIGCLGTLNYTFLQKQRWNNDILDSIVSNNNHENSLSAPISSGSTSSSISWCDKIKNERSKLHVDLHISYPCSQSNSNSNNNNSNINYKSAIVTYLTAGVEEGKGSRIVFTGQQYINGALALGASLNEYLTRRDTLKLLLVKDGFTLPNAEKAKLESVGWTVGVAPTVPIDDKFVPRFTRYKTTYTKISAIGLSEFECVLLMDADTLVVGNIDELLSCNIFNDDHDNNIDTAKENIRKRSEYKVGGTLDYYHRRWKHFNTGSILWNTNSEEMNRVYALTKDESFMTRFESDQIFLNTVYPDRNNIEINNILAEEGIDVGNGEQQHREDWGSVMNLGWNYNAQTHLEVQLPEFWNKHKNNLKIIHYTEKKGWQCPEQYGEAPSEEVMSSLKNCEKKNRDDLCFCGTGYLWWDSLKKANEVAGAATASE